MNKLGTWYAGYTLVDITATGANHKLGNRQEKNQQRNWETVFQVINLRTQCSIIAQPTTPKLVNLDVHQFGSYYSGHHNCWKFIFSSETTDVFGPVEDPTRILRQDFDNVPVIKDLTESVALIDPVFYTDGILRNIYFRVLTHLD